MQVRYSSGQHKIILTDEPSREGVNPVPIICMNLWQKVHMMKLYVVMTGMGADGTKDSIFR